MSHPRHNLIWIAPQRVGSTVILTALEKELSYIRGLFRRNISPERNPRLQDPVLRELRFTDPGAAYQTVVSEAQGPTLIKLEYGTFFGGDPDSDPWRPRLFDLLRRDDVTVIHAWRRDLFRRYASMVHGRKTGMMQRRQGEAASAHRVRLDADHAVFNITRIMDQARTLKAACETTPVIFLEYREITDKSAFARLSEALDLPLPQAPVYELKKVIEDPTAVFENYHEVREEVLARLGPEALDCDLETL